MDTRYDSEIQVTYTRPFLLFLQVGALCLLIILAAQAAPGWPEVEVHATILAVRVEHPSGQRLTGRLLSPTRRLGQKKAPAALLLRGIPGVEDCGDLAYALRAAGLHCLDLKHSGCIDAESRVCGGGEDGAEEGVSLDSVRRDVAAALRCRCLSRSDALISSLVLQPRPEF